jgi:hypothetical protein
MALTTAHLLAAAAHYQAAEEAGALLPFDPMDEGVEPVCARQGDEPRLFRIGAELWAADDIDPGIWFGVRVGSVDEAGDLHIDPPPAAAAELAGEEPAAAPAPKKPRRAKKEK